MNRKQRRIRDKRQQELEKARKKEEIRVREEARKLNAYPVKFNSDEERIPHLDELMSRHKAGETLDSIEIEYLCSSLVEDEKVNFDICDDYRFYDHYLNHVFVKYNLKLESEYSATEKAYIHQKVFSEEAKEKRERELEYFHDKWREKIYNNAQSNDEIYMEVRKETRETIKKMKAVLAEEGHTQEEIEEREKEVILHSKATYITVKKILRNNNRNFLSLTFCGQEVHIDSFSLVHILFRHYSQIVKQYNDDKSHFSPEIHTILLMTILKEILEKIDRSGQLGSLMPDNVFFKYFGRLYRIYFREVNKSEKSRGNYSVQRVNTFYPVELPKDLEDAKKLNPITVDKWLQVLV